MIGAMIGGMIGSYEKLAQVGRAVYYQVRCGDRGSGLVL
jgi:hypothetical protein